MRGRHKKTGKVLLALGAVLVIFGVVWVTVIFPEINKIPGDLVFSTDQQGTVTVFDSDSMQPVTYDVIGTRAYEAVRSTSSTVYLTETCTFVDADTGEPLTFLDSSYLLAIDRAERVNVPGCGDMDREGYFSFPRGVEPGRDYPLWITGNPAPVDATYIGEEQFRGLPVYVYELETPEEGLTVPAGLDTPEMQVHQYIKQFVEPVSGLTVYMESTTSRTARIPVLDDLFPNTVDPVLTEVTVYEDSLVFTDETVDRLVHDASFYHWALPWGSTHLPRLVFGLGIVMLIAGPVLLTRRPREAAALEGIPSEATGLYSKP